MLYGATITCLLAPLVSLVSRLVLGGDLMVPLYLFLLMPLPLGVGWLWRYFRWPGLASVDVTAYTSAALIAEALLGYRITGIFYMVSMVGIYHRSWLASAYGGVLGFASILYVLLRDGGIQRTSPGELITHAFFAVMVTMWSVYLAHIFHERDLAFAKERERADEQRRLYRLLAENTTDLVALHDLEGRFSYVSPSARRLLGVSAEEMMGQHPSAFCHPEDQEKLEEKFAHARSGRVCRGTFRSVAKEGREIWFEITIHPIRGEDGKVQNLQSAWRDITERKAYEQELVRQALHDPLTGLPNRTLFYNRIREALARKTVKEEHDLAVVYLDLDHFKRINDSLGHSAGDELLIQAGKRISECLGPDDTVARIGGDEFAIHVARVDSPENVVELVTRILEALKVPFEIEGQRVVVSPSVGISLNRGRDSTVEDLLREADTAMYQAKKEGGARFVFFDQGMHPYGIARLHLESELAVGIREGQLVLHYQPIVSLADGSVVGVEALVRWNHPDLGVIPPNQFIPVAETTGLIVPLGRWVLQEACRQLAEWEAQYRLPLDFTVCVNVSAHQLTDPRWVCDVKEIVAETGVKPQRLQLEITESSLIRADDMVFARLNAVREMGIRLAIDDYGTGFSSIGYLKWFPFDCLKIARSFVQDVHRNPRDLALASSIISMALQLGLTVNAEGIEEPDQAAALAVLGCQLAQGYHFGRPMPPDMLRTFLPFEHRDSAQGGG